MKHLLFISFSLCTLIGQTAIDSFYKEVIQRGYQHNKDSVFFPDGTACLIVEFNKGSCGAIWKTEDYCIEEGSYVWDEDRCCEGLEPNYDEGVAGQAICAKKKAWYEFNYLSFSLGLALPFVFFLYTAILVRKKLRKRNSK